MSAPAVVVRKVPGQPVPTYDVIRAGEIVGTVFRSGSLPSCYRWHGVGSFRTRAEAVASLLA